MLFWPENLLQVLQKKKIINKISTIAELPLTKVIALLVWIDDDDAMMMFVLTLTNVIAALV